MMQKSCFWLKCNLFLNISLKTIDDFNVYNFFNGSFTSFLVLCFIGETLLFSNQFFHFTLNWLFYSFRFTFSDFSDFSECFNFFSFKDSWYLQWDILTEGSISFAKKWQTGCRLTKTLQQSETRENKLLNKIVFPGIKKIMSLTKFLFEIFLIFETTMEFPDFFLIAGWVATL